MIARFVVAAWFILAVIVVALVIAELGWGVVYGG